MAKNPFLLCFEKPIPQSEIEYLKAVSDDFVQIYPHTFLLHFCASPSSFRMTLEKHFEEESHFVCVVQKPFAHTFFPGKASEPVSPSASDR